MVDRYVGEAVGFRFGQFAIADVVDDVEQFLAHLLVSLLAADDGGKVDVHVVLHLAVGHFVGRDFQDRNDGVSGGRAAAGREGDDLAAAGDHAGDGGDVIARRVHDNGAVFRRLLRLLENFDDRTGATLADAAETLLVERGQTARFIARCRLAGTAVLSGRFQVFFISPADFDDLVVDLRGSGTARDDVLSADPLDGLTHHGGGTEVDETVTQFTDGGVGRNAGGGIGPAALDAEEQFGNIEEFLLLEAGLCGHVAGGSGGLLDGFQRAAFVLDAEGDDRLGGHLLDLLAQLFVPDGLTAEADDDDTVYIRVAGEAGEDLLAHRRVVRDVGAPGVEDDVDRAPDLACDNAARLGTAGAARQDEDVVTDAGTAFRAAVTPELEAVFCLDDRVVDRLFPGVLYQFAVIVSRDTVDVLVGDPVSGGDTRVRLSDEFSVLEDLTALVDIDQRDLVAIGNGLLCLDGLDVVPVTVGDGLALWDFPDTGHDIVSRVH